jgi:hypothetical protein
VLDFVLGANGNAILERAFENSLKALRRDNKPEHSLTE